MMNSEMYKSLSSDLCKVTIVKKYSSDFSSRDWAGLKWRPVLKVWEQLQDKYSEAMQKYYWWKPLAILVVKCV